MGRGDGLGRQGEAARAVYTFDMRGVYNGQGWGGVFKKENRCAGDEGGVSIWVLG
jgi:hypothetical protein